MTATGSSGSPALDACPGVLRLHEAADGLLARIRLPGGWISPAGLRAVARASRLGNGIVELTSRASLQLRGLSAERAGEGERILAGGGLLPSASHERVRNILAAPLAGRSPDSRLCTDRIVVELDRAICAEPELGALSARVLFAVDDGSGQALDPRAELTLRATSESELRLERRGRCLEAGLSPAAAPGRAVAAALALVRSGASAPSAETRAPAAGTPGGPALGELVQRDGRRALCALPRLGRLSPAQLDALAELSGGHPTAVRLSRERTLTLLDRPVDEASLARERLADLGLILDGGSGWRGLSACAGLGACARALYDVRAAAEARAHERSPGAPREHWSACGRRCGRPAGAHVAYTAGEAGVMRTLEAGS